MNLQQWVNGKLQSDSFGEEAKGEVVKMNVEIGLAVVGAGGPVSVLYLLVLQLTPIDLPLVASLVGIAPLAAVAYRDNTNCMLGDRPDGASRTALDGEE